MANKLSGVLPSRSFNKKCEWCNKKYQGTSFSRFCSRKCMYEWRKEQNWEISICKHCKKEYRRRKIDRNWRTGKKRMYCSQFCWKHSDRHKSLVKQQLKKLGNPFSRPEVIEKIRQTKKERYGDSNYNNMKKNEETMMKRYGVHCGFLLNSSNGKRISNIQRKVFKQIKKRFKSVLRTLFT